MYKIYFYSEPTFLYIDSESILDLDLKIVDDSKTFEMVYDDHFFDFNLRSSKSKNWSVTIQSYDEVGKFVVQSNLQGDKLKTKSLKKGKRIQLNFDQITNNKIWASLPPIFEMGEIEYRKGKTSYIRNLKLNNLLN